MKSQGTSKAGEIKEYPYVEGEDCYMCGVSEDIVLDEDGDTICTDCLFQKECEKLEPINHD